MKRYQKDLNAEYYSSRRTKLLKDFDKVGRRAQKYLAARYGDPFANTIIMETREKFDQIIPDIPYIGGRKNQFTPVMVINGWIISFYRAMRKHGKSTEETIAVCCDVSDDFMGSIPTFILWLAGKLAFGKLVLWRMKKQAEQSQKHLFKEDFVYSFIEGDGRAFDWALEFSECAVNKFYEAQGVEELKPYCNFFDITYSKYLGMGINANLTIGNGCRTCKLQYKKNRETIIPERLKEIIPS